MEAKYPQFIPKKKVGFTCGAFDLLHAGHISMLEEAKSQCDHLIVGLHTNPQLDRKEKNKPIQSVFERYVQLKGCKFVDEIVPYDTEHDLSNLLRMLPIDIRILGNEYEDKAFTGMKIEGMEYYFNKRNHDYSTSELRRRLQ